MPSSHRFKTQQTGTVEATMERRGVRQMVAPAGSRAVIAMRRNRSSGHTSLSIAAGYLVLNMEGLQGFVQRKVVLRDNFACLCQALGWQRVSAKVAIEPIDGKLAERFRWRLGVGDIFVVQVSPALQQVDGSLR